MSQPRKVIHLPKVRMLSRGGRPSPIRITNMKSIKPPDPELVKKQEEERLRAQLQKEIVSRSRTCAHKAYECVLPVVGGRSFCARHILDDPSAPYKQCAHVTSSGARCNEPAPVDKEPGLCFEHARASLHSRQRSAAPPPPVITTETLLNQLQHYVRPERTRTTSCASSVSVVSDPADQEQVATHAVDPFKEIDATAVNASFSASIMECASASDSESDSVTLDNRDCRWHDHEDVEDAPCEAQPLWRAGVFTAEEAVSEAKNVLKSLQAAYIRQMGRLRVLLQTERLQYVRALRAEKEQYCSINSQARSGPLTVRERRQLRKLRAYAGYHRKHGVDAVLARKLHHKRAKVNDISNRSIPSQGRCTFAEGGVRCATHVLPAAKHCMKHILLDRHQVLFAACGDLRGAQACREPVAKLPLALPSPSCRYHTGPPAYTSFSLKVNDISNRSIPSQGRCTFAEGGVRCATHVLPAAKHCMKHILLDRHQVLFAACGDLRGAQACREPVAKLPLALPSPSCRYHTGPPAYTSFSLKKEDTGSDTESRSSSDLSHDAPSPGVADGHQGAPGLDPLADMTDP